MATNAANFIDFLPNPFIFNIFFPLASNLI